MAWTSEQINFLYQNRHMTYDEVAILMGKSYESIRKMANRLEIRMKRKVRSVEIKPKKVNNDQIDTISLLKQGKSAIEIAEIYGVKYDFVNILIEKQLENVKIHRKKGRIIPNTKREEDVRQYWKNEDEIFQSIDPVYDSADLSGEEKAIFEGRIKTEGRV